MDKGKLCLYHRVMRRENFEKAASDIFALLVSAQKKSPGQPRVLFVDIDGHRNEEGGFDEDMFELQKEFAFEMLLPFVEEMNFPLYSVKNPNPQENDIPERLAIENAKNERNQDLDRLYIENYSNTEFVSEEGVYSYLEKVSDFLRQYEEEISSLHQEYEAYDPDGWLLQWQSYAKDLIVELYNSFI